MGLFKFIFDVTDEVDRVKRRKEARDALNAKSKLTTENAYNVLGWFAFFGIFALAALLGLGLTDVLPMTPGPIVSMAIILILLIGVILEMQWVNYLKDPKRRILAIVFMAFIGVCVILWVVSVAMLYFVIKKDDGDISGALNTMVPLMQASFIISLQFAIASLIANTILKYGKKLIIIQVVSYVSHVFVDFYLSFLVCCVTVTGGFNAGLFGFLGHPTMISILVIALMYALLSRSILKRLNKKTTKMVLGEDGKFKEVEVNVDTKTETTEPAPKEEKKSAKARLAELKSMLDEGMITQEEYDQKKADIINNM